jgi:peroxiredoxin
VFRKIFIPISVALLLAACTSAPQVDRSGVKGERDRKPAPNFSLQDADGRTVQLSDYRGKVVLLNFWATWCGPCKMEIPWFVEFERKHKDQGFAVVGVSMDEDGWQAVKPFASKVGINYRILMGSDSTAQLYGGIDSLPTTFVIDRDGRIAAVHVGLVSKSSYEKDINEILRTSSRSSSVMPSGRPGLLARAR